MAGLGLLGVSLSHCAESVGALTGSPGLLAWLSAIGIDAGMVAAELAELTSHGTRAASAVRPWSRAYMLGAAGLFFLALLQVLPKANPVPIKDPFLNESLTYHN